MSILTVLHQSKISISIRTITARHSLFPASFARTAFIGNCFRLTPKKNLRLFWRTIRVYQVPLLIPKGLASAFTPRELSILTIIRTRTACLGYTNQTTLPFVVFDYGGHACLTRANKVSHFRRSKVTRLAAIHLCYAYHSFRFLPP